MKKLYTVVLVFILIISFSAGASAASDKILKGSPTIDGILDEIYSQSVEVTLGEAFYSTNSDNATDVTAKAYLLYDDKNLYVCVVVNDDDILSRDDVYINDGVNPWENELVEIWVDEGMAGTKSKVSLDANNKHLFSDPVEFADNVKAQAIKEDKSYTVEYAIPLAAAGAEGGKYGFSLQVNDLFADNHVVALGSQEPIEYTFGTAVVPPATEAPTEDPADDTPVAPQTSDITMALAVLAIGSTVAVLFFKKKAAS